MTWRRIFLTLGLLAFILLVALNIGYFQQFVGLLGQVKWYVLLFVVVVQGIGYYAMACFYRAMLKILGHNLKLQQLYKTSLAINFVNQAFPSGGISGAGFLSRALSTQVPAGQSTLVQLGRYAFTYLSFVLVLSAGFLMLFLGGGVSKVTVRLTLLLIMLVIAISVGVVVLLTDRAKVERLSAGIVRVINAAIRLVRRRKRRKFITFEMLDQFLNEFYYGYELLKERKGRWHNPLVWAFVANLTEVLTIYVVFLAFGAVINPGAVIAAYTLANIFSLMSVFTSGAGVYEAAMITALVALSVPFALAVSVVLVYRIANMAIFLPIGFHYYRELL